MMYLKFLKIFKKNFSSNSREKGANAGEMDYSRG